MGWRAPVVIASRLEAKAGTLDALASTLEVIASGNQRLCDTETWLKTLQRKELRISLGKTNPRSCCQPR